MATTASKTSKRKWPAIILVVVTLLLLVFVIRLWDRTPRTDDAYVYADTIDVVPEVSGRIVDRIRVDLGVVSARRAVPQPDDEDKQQ